LAFFWELPILPVSNIKSAAICDEIIDRVSEGETITAICASDHMPTIRSVMRWLAKDRELDERMHRARIRGTLIQADEAVDAQRSVINGSAAPDDPKRLQAIVTAANNMGHQANARLSKIDTRYKDKQEVSHIGPVVVGWEKEDKDKLVPDSVLDAVTPEKTMN
jgi:hypothetical protein